MVAFIVVFGYLFLVVLQMTAKKLELVTIDALIKSFSVVCFFYGFYKLVCLLVDK